MQPHDLVRARHLIEALQDCLDFPAGRARSGLDHDRMLQLALARALEIAGEAASKISQPGRDELPMVPWAKIIGMRVRLAHAYFALNLDILWDTATVDAPALLAQLRAAVPGN